MKRVLFVCVHNAGRSQIAEAFFNQLARERGVPVVAHSAGTAPGESINPVAAQAMAEVGVSMAGQKPRQLTPELVTRADRVITMGCGVEASLCPAGFYITEDWQLSDPHGQAIEAVREVREQVRRRAASHARGRQCNRNTGPRWRCPARTTISDFGVGGVNGPRCTLRRLRNLVTGRPHAASH
jgi:arsenate reductase (thioredoxin)